MISCPLSLYHGINAIATNISQIILHSLLVFSLNLQNFLTLAFQYSTWFYIARYRQENGHSQLTRYYFALNLICLFRFVEIDFNSLNKYLLMLIWVRFLQWIVQSVIVCVWMNEWIFFLNNIATQSFLNLNKI